MMRTLLGMFLALMLSLHGTAGCAAIQTSPAPPPDACASMEAMPGDAGTDKKAPDDKASHSCERLCYLAGIAVAEPGLGARLVFPATQPSAWPAARHDYFSAPATPPPKHA